MTGRTVLKWSKVYSNGYDITGLSRTFGPLTCSAEEADATTLGDAVKNALPNQAMVNIGAINAVFDNTATSGSHALLNTANTKNILIALGMRAAPVAGDPVFCGSFLQVDNPTEYSGANALTINAKFSGWSREAVTALYSMPWGVLVHAKSAETAANTATGLDDNGGASTHGGFMAYHLFSSNGTVTLKVQDAATNSDGSFADLVSSGVIDASTTPVSALVALSTTATVRQYLRWQIALGTATTCTFAIGFVRA